MNVNLYNNKNCGFANAFLCRGLCPPTTSSVPADETPAPIAFVLNDLDDKEEKIGIKFDGKIFIALTFILIVALLSLTLILFHKKRELISVRVNNLIAA